MNTEEEQNVKQYVEKLIPPSEHSPDCYTRHTFGYNHKSCGCDCHQKKGSPYPSKENIVRKTAI